MSVPFARNKPEGLRPAAGVPIGYYVGDEFKRDVVKVERLLILKLACDHFLSMPEDQALNIVERGFAYCPECSLPKVRKMSAAFEKEAKS